MLDSSTLDSLRSIFSDFTDIEAVYLFGSSASQTRDRHNDIDLGIVYSNPAIEEKKLDLYTSMVKQGIDNTDLVFLNSADLVLQFEIIHHNQLIYSTKDFNHGELLSNVVRKYFDFKPYLDRQREAYKKHILYG